MSDSSIHDLIKRLAGTADEGTDVSHNEDTASYTESAYVEKLASAVEFILSESETPETIAPEVADASSTEDVAAKLKASLKAKLTQSSKKTSDSKEEMASAIISRLKGMHLVTDADPKPKKDESDDQDEQLFYADTADENAITDTDNSSDTTEVTDTDEPVLKAASAEVTLAEVLEASFSADEPDTSITDGDVKTAGVRGDVEPMARKTATDLLRKRLMAKVGKEV
jgi:hypothetical protein